jgi:hypothetical protein
MKNRVVIAKEVNVPELYFKNEGRLTAFPRRVELDGREYTFMDGLRYLVQRGQQLVQIFDMTDGSRDYRLQFDDARHSWTLVDMTV